MSTFCAFTTLRLREPGLSVQEVATRLKSHPLQIVAWDGRLSVQRSEPSSAASAREGLDSASVARVGSDPSTGSPPPPSSRGTSPRER